MTVPVDIRVIIELHRKHQGLSRYVLARRSGFPTSTVYSYLSGKTDGSGKLIGALLKVLSLGLIKSAPDEYAKYLAQVENDAKYSDTDWLKDSTVHGRKIRVPEFKRRSTKT